MKGSRIIWIGWVPEQWQVTRTKYCVEFINGYAFDSSDMHTSGKYPVIRIGDIKNGHISYDDCLFINDNINLEYYRIKKEDLLLAMSGATVGKVGISDTDTTAYINQRVGIIRSKVNKFIYYALSTDAFLQHIYLESVGSAQPNISSIGVGEFVIPIPSVEEQRRIANYLDNVIGKVDNILSDLREQIEILANYKKSLITETVKKGLNPNAPMKDSGVEWIGGVSATNEIIKLKYYSYMKGRIGWQGLNSEDFIDEGPYCVTGTDFVNGSINWKSCYHVSEERYNMDPNIQLRVGDLLVTKDGTIGKLAMIKELPEKACLNSHLLIIRPLKDVFINEYLYYVMLSDMFSTYYRLVSTGSTMDSLSQEKMGNFQFPIHSIEEQKNIVDYLDDKCQRIDEIIQNKSVQITKLEDYKQSLIFEYVTGKKRVKEAM